MTGGNYEYNKFNASTFVGNVRKVVIHSNYNEERFLNDIGLLVVINNVLHFGEIHSIISFSSKEAFLSNTKPLNRFPYPLNIYPMALTVG